MLNETVYKTGFNYAISPTKAIAFSIRGMNSASQALSHTKNSVILLHLTFVIIRCKNQNKRLKSCIFFGKNEINVCIEASNEFLNTCYETDDEVLDIVDDLENVFHYVAPLFVN